jgi:hypothetical protein
LLIYDYKELGQPEPKFIVIPPDQDINSLGNNPLDNISMDNRALVDNRSTVIVSEDNKIPTIMDDRSLADNVGIGDKSMDSKLPIDDPNNNNNFDRRSSFSNDSSIIDNAISIDNQVKAEIKPQQSQKKNNKNDDVFVEVSKEITKAYRKTANYARKLWKSFA